MNLYLIPLPISSENIETIPAYVLEILHSLKYLIVENTRTSRRFLRSSGFKGNIDEIEFLELDKHDKSKNDINLLEPALKGYPMGLMSESGVPSIADPGFKIVRLAHKAGIKVIPLVGPSSIFLALSASGLNGQIFSFLGYLPIKLPELNRKLQNLEKLILSKNSTQIFIEAPYRNTRMVESILKVVSGEIKLCIASEITSQNEYIVTRQIKDWVKTEIPDLDKKNCIFLLGM